MAIVRWDPWRDLAAFERQLDQMMGRLGGGTGGSREQRAWSPSLDVHQEGETMVICAEVAGIDPDQIDISVEDDVLTISGSREDHSEVEEGQWIRRERYSGQFRRSVSLPPGVDPEQIQASARNGLIEIRVPRPTQLGAHRVPLRVGAGSEGGNGGSGQSIDVTSNAGANAESSDEGTVAAGIVPGTEEQAATTGTSPGEKGAASPGTGSAASEAGFSGGTATGGSDSSGKPTGGTP